MRSGSVTMRLCRARPLSLPGRGRRVGKWVSYHAPGTGLPPSRHPAEAWQWGDRVAKPAVTSGPPGPGDAGKERRATTRPGGIAVPDRLQAAVSAGIPGRPSGGRIGSPPRPAITLRKAQGCARHRAPGVGLRVSPVLILRLRSPGMRYDTNKQATPTNRPFDPVITRSTTAHAKHSDYHAPGPTHQP